MDLRPLDEIKRIAEEKGKTICAYQNVPRPSFWYRDLWAIDKKGKIKKYKKTLGEYGNKYRILIQPDGDVVWGKWNDLHFLSKEREA